MSRVSKDILELYLQYGIDHKHRRVFLYDDIEPAAVRTAIQGLYMMDSENSNPIELRISSYGGDVYDMFGLHDVTRTMVSPVHTVGIGKVMSSAVLLVACGTAGQRWAGANTTFMIHVPSWDSEDTTLHNHRINVKETERLWDRWYDLMGTYTKKDSRFWRRMCEKKTDIFFDADQAQEYGIIDNIWNEKD